MKLYLCCLWFEITIKLKISFSKERKQDIHIDGSWYCHFIQTFRHEPHGSSTIGVIEMWLSVTNYVQYLFLPTFFHIT